MLTRAQWEAADLETIVRDGARACGVEARLSVEGPAVALKPQTAVTLAMAMHELLTNAIKYGALSTAGGRVQVSWTLSDERAPRLQWIWREHDGPVVSPPSRRGFGSRLLDSAMAAEPGGRAEMDFAPDGLVCKLQARLS